MPALRQAGCALLCLAAAAADALADSKAKLLEAVDIAVTEEEATQVLAPYMGDLKKLDTQVVEKVVLRQFWGLARDIVAKSHTQQVDLSFAVRKAVRSLKDEADELLRTLNPKYGLAQQVAPAFQWAQNDTCIFLTIKYTVRWNAPGALEVTEPSAIIAENSFNFTGLGKHSNNKYKYVLSLAFFDLILASQSSWSTASVGKMSVTLRKKWARKWPRLLGNKKTKIGNMHVWMEMQEKLDSTLGGMPTASNSPVTCAAADKLYCLATDTCKKAANCSQCPGKTIPKESEHYCAGVPTDKATISFKDTDMDEHEFGGEVKITKARNEFDIDAYVVYWGKDDSSKLDDAPIGEVAPTGADTEVRIPANTRFREGATHLLVFSRNEFGEYATPGSTTLRDAVLPKGKPSSLSFDDEDGEKGEVSGTVTIGKADNEAQLDEYGLHWGRSATRKISGASFIRDIGKQEGKDVTHFIARNTKVPEGATHLLAFAKNEHGESPSPVSLKIVDHTKPCITQGAADCPEAAQVTQDLSGKIQATISVRKAKEEADLDSYVLYWGRAACGSEGGQSGVKNGHLKDLPVQGSLDYELPADLAAPQGTTHILVFSKNKYGESEFCASADFVDSSAAKKEL